MKQELKLLPTGDVEGVNRSLKDGFGGLGFCSQDLDKMNYRRSPLSLDPGAVSQVAHDNFHRVVSSDPIYCRGFPRIRCAATAKKNVCHCAKDGAVKARTVNGSKNMF